MFINMHTDTEDMSHSNNLVYYQALLSIVTS